MVSPESFADCVAAELAERMGKVIPCLDARLDAEDLPSLSERQKILLGSLLLELFDGTGAVVGRLADGYAVLARWAPRSLGDEAEDWLKGQE